MTSSASDEPWLTLRLARAVSGAKVELNGHEEILR